MAGSSRNYGNPEDKIRNSEELSKAAALRELEKARVRECQMEKTVRWWTVCTAGWRKKWSKLRQENEELRKQIKSYKSQLNGITQDCATLTNRLEYFDVHNAYLKCELNKLLLKYGEEGNDHIQEILNAPDIIKPKVFTCVECQERRNEPKTSENPLSTPDTENQLLLDAELKYPLMEDGGNEIKKMEVLTEMISKIFGELQSLQAEYAQNNEGMEMKDLSEFPINREQLYHLQLYSLTKKLEMERKEKKELYIKLEMANTNISILSEKVEEIAAGDFILETDLKIPIESLSLSDEE